MITFVLTLAIGPVPLHLPYANAPVPLAHATLQDREIAGLGGQDEGQATLALSRTEIDGRIMCTVIATSGSPSIGAASCRLLILKLQTMGSLKRPDRNDILPERMIVRWQTAAQAQLRRSDYGGATPLNPEYWITSADYSAAGGHGNVQYSIDISTFGLVTACRILQSSGDVRLDARTCKALTIRARFLPALDAQKMPVPTRGTGTIMWQKPG